MYHHSLPRALNPHSSTTPLFTLGDGIYAVVDRMLVPFRKKQIPGSSPPVYGPLTQRELRMNEKFGRVRGRVEHVSDSWRFGTVQTQMLTPPRPPRR